MSDFKETEFNSSVATLQRINSLMCLLHEATLGVLDGNNKSIRLELIRRLYLEGRKKFTKEEKARVEKFEDELSEIQKEVINLKPDSNVYYTKPEQFMNKKAKMYWFETNNLVRKYEFFVVGCLDDHGMLLKNKQESDETPDDWE